MKQLFEAVFLIALALLMAYILIDVGRTIAAIDCATNGKITTFAKTYGCATHPKAPTP